MDTGKVKELLTHKVGPLPAIGWAALVGGTYVAYAYYKRAKTPVTTNAAQQAIVAGNPDLGGADDFSNGYTDASDIVNGSTATTTYVPPAISDNASWATQAVNWLIATGITPTEASHVVSTYIYGTGATLNTSQGAALNLVLSHFGSPPEGVLDPPTIADPVPDPTPTPVPTPTAPVATPAAPAEADAARQSVADLAPVVNDPNYWQNNVPAANNGGLTVGHYW